MICPISQRSITFFTPSIRTPCNHLFKRSALGTWLTYKNICPLCRRELDAKKLFYPPERLYHILMSENSKKLRYILKLISIQLLFINLFYKAGKLPHPKIAQGLTTLIFSLSLVSIQKSTPHTHKNRKRPLLESTLLFTSQAIRTVAIYQLFGKKCAPYTLLYFLI